MKLTTALMIGVFTVGSGSALADHRFEDKHSKHKHHLEKHHWKAEHHERKAIKHYRRARRHDRLAHRENREHNRDSYYRNEPHGRVINVEPVYRSVSVPVRDNSCLEHDYKQPRYNSHTGAVLGAVIGGALGHRIGDAHGDADAAAIAGGLIGATMGYDIDRRASYNRKVRVEGPCRVKHTRYQTRRELVEYKVTYRYNGETHRTRMEYDPGEWVKLNVDVSPA